MSETVNIVIAGLGGQGVLKSADILADVVFGAGLDVKKSEVHGMSQRGGSVASDVRFGAAVYSPMVPPAEADFLVVLDPTQIEVSRPRLKDGGKLFEPAMIDAEKVKNPRAVNVALLGALSAHLDFPEEAWLGAIRANLPAKVHALNIDAFALGRAGQ